MAKYNDNGLTDRQQRFCDEYLVDMNGTQAAIRAGYSARTANEQAAQLLAKLSIKQYVAERQAKQQERVEVSADRVLTEVQRLAYLDPRRMFNANGELLPISELPDDIAAAISSFEVSTVRRPGGEATDVDYVVKVKFWDKRASLDLLGRNQKLWTDKLEVSKPEHEAGVDAVEHHRKLKEKHAATADQS